MTRRLTDFERRVLAALAEESSGSRWGDASVTRVTANVYRDAPRVRSFAGRITHTSNALHALTMLGLAASALAYHGERFSLTDAGRAEIERGAS